MIDTNTIVQAAQDAAIAKATLAPYLPALAVAAAWAGREIRNFNNWVFDLGEYFIAHGGMLVYLKKIFWNPSLK